MSDTDSTLEFEQKYSIKQVSEILDGLPTHTIRHWVEVIGIPVERDDINIRWFSENDISLLSKVKEAKSQGANLPSIRKMFIAAKLVPNVVLPENKFESLVQVDVNSSGVKNEALAAFLKVNLSQMLSDTISEMQVELVADLTEQFNKSLKVALEEQKESFLEILKQKDEDMALKVSDALEKISEKQVDDLDKMLEQRDEKIVSQIVEYVRPEPEEELPVKKWFQFWK